MTVHEPAVPTPDPSGPPGEVSGSDTRVDPTDPPAIRTLDSRVVYRNPWMTVREDRIQFADGTTSIYGVVDKADYAVVIAEQDGHFHLVQQFRYSFGRRSWEFPMGGWPTGKSGTAEELAKAELSEETGLTAATWVHLGHLIQSGGYSPQAFDIYLATDLTPGPHQREQTESDMVHLMVSETEFRRMIADGRIDDGPTIAAYAMLQLRRDDGVAS